MAMCSARNGASHHLANLWTTATHQFAIVHRRPTAAGDIGALVCKRPLHSNAWETFDPALIPGNPLQIPIDPLDAHEQYALCVDGLGHVHIAGGQHSDSMSQYVMSAAPGAIDSWVAGVLPDLSDSGTDQHTYHVFNAFSDGTVVWFLDQQDGDTGRGRDWLLLRRGPTATTWEKLGGTSGEIAIAQNPPDNSTRTDMDRSYIFATVIDDDDRLHVFGCWREFTQDANTQKDCYYVRSDDKGVTFTNISGVVQAQPFTYSAMSAGCRVDNQPSFSRNYGGTAVDGQGNPMVVLQVQDTSTYVRMSWNGTAWVSAPANSRFDGTTFAQCSGSPMLAGMGGDVYYLGSVQGSYRVLSLTTGDRARFGDAPAGMEAHADPIALRQGRLEVLVPDGDAPVVHSIGENAHVLHAG